jgi:hypothetical protein
MNTDAYADPAANEPGASHEYHSPQPLAIITLALGLLSFLALFRTTLWIFPIVTLVLGLVSLRTLAGQTEKIGRKAAVAGMVLAVFFWGWAAAYDIVREQWLIGHAREYADAWLELLQQQKLREAHQLHVSRGKRAEGNISLEEFYKKQRYAQSDFESFYDKEPLKDIAEFAPHAKFTYDGSRDRVSDPYSERVVLRYIATYDSHGQARTLPFRVLLLRRVDLSTGDHYWEVEGVSGE